MSSKNLPDFSWLVNADISDDEEDEDEDEDEAGGAWEPVLGKPIA